MISGSIESVALSGREFAVAADAEVQRKLGGYENEVQANGNGTARIIKTRTTWQLDGLTAHVSDDEGDQEYLQDLADGKDFFIVAITLANGETYQGRGMITGDLQYSTQNGTAAISLQGTGELTKQ